MIRRLLSQPRNLFTVCIAEGRVVHIMLNVTHYYANNSLCSTNGTIQNAMLKIIASLIYAHYMHVHCA